jgi:carboxypeptidase T
MRTSAGARRTVTFRSLQDDLAALRSSAVAPLGVVDQGVTSIGQSEQGREIHVIRIGKNPAMPILIVGCHHAREWISVEVPYLIADYLVRQYSSDPNVRRIVDASDIWIVPLLNPDGHERSVLTRRLWRKNFPTDPTRRSVDLNRNYATAHWNIPTGHFSNNPASDIYKGPSQGYAKEVVAMQQLIRDHQFKGALSFHAFGRFITFPWAGRPEQHPDPLLQEMAGHLERVIDAKGKEYVKVQGSNFYPLSSGGRITPAQGVIPGDFEDYVVEQVPNALTLTVELEPASSDPRGFVLPESEIEPTFNLHRAAILTFLNCVGTMRNPPHTRRLLLQQDADNALIVFQPECWRAFATY